MVLTITETIVVRCERKQTSLNELRAYCSSIGVTTTQQPEFTVLTQKLKTRRSALRPLLNCDGLETIFSGVETLGKQSLQHLSTQHNLDVDLGRDTDSMRDAVVDHITSGGCQASTSGLCASINDGYRGSESGAKANGDLETHILRLTAKKGTLRKRHCGVLTSRDIES